MARPGPRRRTVADAPVCNYAAVGATANDDLLRYPPKGHRAAEYRAKLGSGEERFEKSVARLMRWGVQLGSGLEVVDVRQETMAGDAYRSLAVDPSSNASVPVRPHAHLFDFADPVLIRPGATADIVTRTGPFRFSSPVRVLTVIAEQHRFGFVYGTLPGGPEAGEQRFVVTHEPDDSVWITIREFVRPGSFRFRLVWWYANRYRKRIIRRYLAALHPTTPVPGASARPADEGPYGARATRNR
ncbi:DUF1990 domain-containing protein [Pseudoclavibacter chungangensis]|uniref:DUF1990 domain-containing protein n=1 Tax=Pseudoclavibacter chungangensis TaxID=587635 RepID=A0A7J5BQG3_9MICO|nr:DUF1990 family protein [Pseudoclavibacter chungangensis]KAB1656268.1 DUF1990 domain-containing protein [Pseudoclavibacter chungangensis]NYJ67026.1 uncharacterized protein (UPF0548 family) [Pseudoclavibacter chungangensis]